MTTSKTAQPKLVRETAFTRWLELMRSGLFLAMTVRADRLG